MKTISSEEWLEKFKSAVVSNNKDGIEDLVDYAEDFFLMDSVLKFATSFAFNSGSEVALLKLSSKLDNFYISELDLTRLIKTEHAEERRFFAEYSGSHLSVEKKEFYNFKSFVFKELNFKIKNKDFTSIFLESLRGCFLAYNIEKSCALLKFAKRGLVEPWGGKKSNQEFVKIGKNFFQIVMNSGLSLDKKSEFLKDFFDSSPDGFFRVEGIKGRVEFSVLVLKEAIIFMGKNDAGPKMVGLEIRKDVLETLINSDEAVVEGIRSSLGNQFNEAISILGVLGFVPLDKGLLVQKSKDGISVLDKWVNGEAYEVLVAHKMDEKILIRNLIDRDISLVAPVRKVLSKCLSKRFSITKKASISSFDSACNEILYQNSWLVQIDNEIKPVVKRERF